MPKINENIAEAGFGLNQQTVESIKRVFRGYLQIERAIIYGSRAKGTHRKGSDIDITLLGNELDLTLLNKIDTELDDLLLPYKIDLSVYGKIDNQELKGHIHRVGKVFYEREKA